MVHLQYNSYTMQATSSRGGTANTLITITLLLLLLYVGQGILKPLAFASLLAILLISPSRFFEKAGFPRGIAALISLLLAFVVFFVIFYLRNAQSLEPISLQCVLGSSRREFCLSPLGLADHRSQHMEGFL